MTDYDEILDGTVDEVKEKIDEAADLDYEELLKREEEEKDRKTVKEYIEQKIGEGVDEEINSDEDISEEDVLQEIEKETKGGILGSYSRNSVFAGGLLLGLLIGLVAVGLSSAGMGMNQISKNAAHDRVTKIVGDQVNVSSSFGEEHGLYTFNITTVGQRGNKTVTQTRTYYMTQDGELILPTQSPLTGQSMVINVDQAIEAAQEARNQEPANETSTNTTQ
ncbi:MAG: hypothetical protein ABEK00_03505 [Candidatus Nanohaloarchaea archaeon]